MNADEPVSWVRDWLNARISDHSICVHLRSSAAKIPSYLGEISGDRRTSVSPAGRREPIRSTRGKTEDAARNAIHREDGAHPPPAHPRIAPASQREPIQGTRDKTK